MNNSLEVRLDQPAPLDIVAAIVQAIAELRPEAHLAELSIKLDHVSIAFQWDDE